MNPNNTHSRPDSPADTIQSVRGIELLTEAQTAAIMHVAQGTLRNARATGSLDLPFIKLTPTKRGKVRYRQSDVVAWIEARTHRNTQEAVVAVEHA